MGAIRNNNMVHTKEAATAEQKITQGIIFAKRVAREKCKHHIGEKIVLNRRIPGSDAVIVGGVITGLYPHFVLVDCGFYNATISYKDMVLGAKVI
jgi:hypothetical protein